MANEITHNFVTGSTLYFCCFQQDGDVFLTGGASDEVWGTGGRTAADYDEAMTEEASSGHYKGSMAAGVGAGVYQIVVFLQAGGAPADADVALAQGEIYWNGTSEETLKTIFDKLPTNYIMGSATQDDQDTIIHSGTVPDNTSTTDSIKLAASASGVNDIYNENLVVLISGTGSGQSRLIADYIGGTKTAVVRHSWTITPDNTTVYRIYPYSGILLANTGLAAGATSTSITLNTSAPATADIYEGHTIYISGGTGEGQARLITGYAADRVATVYPAWDVTPAAAASVYIVLPIGVGEIFDTVTTIASDLVVVDSNIDTIVSDLTVVDSNLDTVVSDVNYIIDLERVQYNDFPEGSDDDQNGSSYDTRRRRGESTRPGPAVTSVTLDTSRNPVTGSNRGSGC
jgi:hypothetical protein